MSLLVGTLIWAAAIDSEFFSVEVEIPLILEVTNRYVILEDYSDSITVKLNGSGLEMLSYQIGSPLSGISRNIPVTGITSFPANVTLELSTSDVLLQGSVAVTKLVPDQVSFTMDTVISRELPVSVLSSDGIPSRFRIVSVTPKFITVSCPSSIVLLMDSVTTEVISTSSGSTTASLAFSSDMVAYSEGLVQIRVEEPSVPVKDPYDSRAGY